MSEAVNVEIQLVAVDKPLADAWRRWCGELDAVTVREADICSVSCDAFVSPANSFGFMDGGIDATYLKHFGRDLQDGVRKQIRDHHDGELLVGEAMLVPTNRRPEYLIVAPTMRVPMRLPADSVNPYLAMRAIVRLIRKNPHVRSIAVPGLGTGIGGIGPNTCARQVRAALDDFLFGKLHTPATWAEASSHHQSLYTDRPTRLQHE